MALAEKIKQAPGVASETDDPPQGRWYHQASVDPVRVRKTAAVVADRIRKQIVRRELLEGVFLPPETQLLAALGISRPTLREAFRILESENLIEVSRGARNGARVNHPDVETASRYAGFVLQSQGTTLADVYEARLAIEPYITRRLAERRPENATRRLRCQLSLLHGMVEEQRYAEFVSGLVAFHCMLVEVSEARTLLFVTRQLQGVVAQHQIRMLQRNTASLSELRRGSLLGLRSFEKLIALIEAADSEGAESHWRRHLVKSNGYWVPKGRENDVIDAFE